MTLMPMFLAVPWIMRMADASLVALVSGSFLAAISCTGKRTQHSGHTTSQAQPKLSTASAHTDTQQATQTHTINRTTYRMHEEPDGMSQAVSLARMPSHRLGVDQTSPAGAFHFFINPHQAWVTAPALATT